MVSFQNDILPLKNELFRLALRITLNAADAEDVVQDTMLKVWKRRNDWEQIESIEAFCLTICRNLALDRLRHKDYQSQTLDMAADPVDASHTANIHGGGYGQTTRVNGNVDIWTRSHSLGQCWYASIGVRYVFN